MSSTKDKKTLPLSEQNDEALIALYREGNTEAMEVLLERYKQVVKSKARYYFLLGADTEDIIQEGMIGLYKAVCSFDPQKQTAFSSFAEVCIKRQMFSAIKSASRHKHLPLNSYISLYKPVYESNSDMVVSDIVSAIDDGNPETIIIDKESFVKTREDINKVLSEFECRVLSLYLKGKTYQQIADTLQKEVKSIDNALQRIKKKLIFRWDNKSM